ncbi:MAG: hypothetical protein J5I47_13275 [Vicingus serpentipes]|nr:hypothetical protein [Vicingus serpentipes]
MVALPNIGLFDLCLGVVYLFLIYFFAYRFQRHKINENPEYRYLLVGLTAKIIGGIAFVLLSVYYYKKGDTFLYFQIAEDLRSFMKTNTIETFKLISTPYQELNEAIYNPLEKYNYYYERTTTWSFSKIVFFFNLIGFGSYLVSSLLFSFTSFLGLWLGYNTLCKVYTKSSKLMLIPFFLIPTALIWSSGILKDTIVIGDLGVLIYSSANLILNKKQLVQNSILFTGGILLILLLKPILLFVFTPFLIVLWTVYSIKKIVIHNKIIIAISVTIVSLGLGYAINNNFLKSRPKYQITHLIERLKVFHTQHPEHPIAKSKYELGEINYSPLGLAIKTPEAINATFFRPYLWETHNLPTRIAAVESFLLFLFFIIVVIRLFRAHFLEIFLNNKEVILMLFFSIIYAIIVGLGSTNFGALSRHKIPAIFFFLLALIILFRSEQHSSKEN